MEDSTKNISRTSLDLTCIDPTSQDFAKILPTINGLKENLAQMQSQCLEVQQELAGILTKIDSEMETDAKNYTKTNGLNEFNEMDPSHT